MSLEPTSSPVPGLERAGPLPSVPPRDPSGHKGTFGTVCVVGGQAAPPHVMVGGPAFSALAALRSGVGLAVLAMPEPVLTVGLSVAPSATGLALPVDADGRPRASASAELLDGVLNRTACLAIGPGFGAEMAQQQIVVRLVTQDTVPVVVDADALNCLAAMHDFAADVRAAAILTPHPGEFRRLADALGLEALDPLDDVRRPAAAAALSRRIGCVTVLKGHRTIVSDGLRTWRCEAGNAALATAGSGDVLTGVIAALVAQFHRTTLPAASRRSLFECACLAVEAHARAADGWAKRHGTAGMLATDLIDELPAAVESLRSA